MEGGMGYGSWGREEYAATLDDSARSGHGVPGKWRERMLKWSGHDEAEVSSHGSLAPTRLGMVVEEQWPAFKLVGFGFYYAWIWVSYNSSTLVSSTAAAELPPDTLSLTYLASTLALALMLLVLAFAQKVSRRLIMSSGLSLVAAAVAGLATVGTYLSSGLGAEANPFLIASGIASGIGTSVIVLRFGAVYAKVPARDAVMYAAASFVFAGMVYFLVIGLPGPVGMVLAALLPAMAVMSTLTNTDWVVSDTARTEKRPLALQKFFVRLLVAVGVFSLVVGISRGFAVPYSSISSLNSDGALIVFSTICAAAVMFLVVGLLRRQFDVSRLYYPITIAVAAAILLTPMVGGTDFGGQFVTVGYNCFVLVIWCLLAYVAYTSQLSPILVFGLGRGASALGTTVGWMGGLEMVRNHALSGLSLQTVSVAMAFALLVVSMLVLNDRLIGDTLRPVDGAESPREGASPAEGAGVAGVSASLPVENAPEVAEGAGAEGADEGAVEFDDERRPGRYQARCNAVAERYGLSPRERDVFDLLVRGRSIDYIAQNLVISFNTAKSHIRHIYVKVDVHSRQELLDVIDRED